MRPQVAKYSCLSKDITPDTVAEVKQIRRVGGIRTVNETVGKRLAKMGARCKAGKLVDAKRKEIRFYKLQGCWGNPPADYLEILETEKNKLLDLRKRFTLIEITCNPSAIVPL
ncbi:MAG: hypothetical protein ABIO91_04735 [Pyrinomonadaceae bacterium]